METNSLGFIGGGRITKIFLQAFSNSKTKFDSIVVFDVNPDTLNGLKMQFPQIKIVETIHQAASQSMVVIALHPPLILETLDKIADDVSSDAAVISLAPKITIERIAAKLKTANIARVIPNATSYVNEGYNPVTFASEFENTKKEATLGMLKLLGQTFEVAESKLEAYAILSAMLPTYFWFQWNELTKLGLQMGLSFEESKLSVQQTLLASVHLMFESDLTPDQVMDLIPVKPIAEHQSQIIEIYESKLISLFEKIKP